jgi:hypothetical protein
VVALLEILQDPAWESIGVFVTLLISLISGIGWYIRGPKQRQEVDSKFFAQAPPISSVRQVPRQSMEQQAQLLLRVIYDLAEGNPGQWVAGAEAAERASIPFTAQDHDPLFRYLKQSGLITTDNLVHNEVCKLTPKRIREVEQVVSSMVPPDSMYSSKG